MNETVQVTVDPSDRPMVHETVIHESQQFAEFVMKNVPEVEAVAITISWKPPLTNLPSVVVRGKHGGLNTAGEAVRMLEQLLLGVKYLHGQIDGALHNVDNIMALKASTLRELEEKIEQCNATLGGVSDTFDDRERSA